MMKKGVALLITLMFIIAITFSIGVGLSYTKRAQNTLSDENFLFQSEIILNDVLNVLKGSQNLKQIKDAYTLNMFLSQSSFIPLESSGISITLELSSARSKFNLRSLLSADRRTIDINKVNLLQSYFSKKMVNTSFVDILLDGIGGVKPDLSYNSNIFNNNEALFRDYFVSSKHFDKYKEFYKNSFYDNSLSKIDFDKLFYYGDDTNGSYNIDLNYATKELWEMMLGVGPLRAQELVNGAGRYTQDSPPLLSRDENASLAKFKTSYYEPFVNVKVEITQNTSKAKIAFEYDIANQKGYNFSYEI